MASTPKWTSWRPSSRWWDTTSPSWKTMCFGPSGATEPSHRPCGGGGGSAPEGSPPSGTTCLGRCPRCLSCPHCTGLRTTFLQMPGRQRLSPPAAVPACELAALRQGRWGVTLCMWAAPVSSVFVVIDLFAEFPPSLHVSPSKGSGEAAGTCGVMPPGGAAEGIFRQWLAVRCDETLCPRDSRDLLSEGFCGNMGDSLGATGLCG